MDLLGTFFLLWQRRILIAAGAVAATAIAVAVLQGVSLGPLGSAGGGQVVGVASGSVLIDTPRSQLLNADPKGAETLPMRALLYADLLARDDVKAGIARQAGLKPEELDVLPPASRLEPPVSTPLVEQAIVVAAAPRATTVLSVYADGESPLISVDAHAPDGQRAEAVVAAAAGALESLVAREGGKQLRVDVVKPPRGEEVASRSRAPIFAMLAAVVFFAAWCGGIIVLASPRLRAA
jgi:hypothetical protein